MKICPRCQTTADDALLLACGHCKTPFSAVMAASRTCRYCLKVIPPTAKVCHRCQRHQNRFWNQFRFDHLGLVIAFFMMLLGWEQLKEARRQRDEAAEALKKAQNAERTAVALVDSLESTRVEVNAARSQIASVAHSAKAAGDELRDVAG